MNKEADTTNLQEDLSRLRADIESLSRTVKDIAADRGAEGVRRVKETAEKVREGASEAQRRVESEIANRPLTPLAKRPPLTSRPDEAREVRVDTPRPAGFPVPDPLSMG